MLSYLGNAKNRVGMAQKKWTKIADPEISFATQFFLAAPLP
jgi:hypothetical protein